VASPLGIGSREPFDGAAEGKDDVDEAEPTYEGRADRQRGQTTEAPAGSSLIHPYFLGAGIVRSALARGGQSVEAAG
jgi:hypothetical protein